MIVPPGAKVLGEFWKKFVVRSPYLSSITVIFVIVTWPQSVTVI